MRIIFIPPARVSKSMLALKDAVAARISTRTLALKSNPQNSRAVRKDGDIVVNWGGSESILQRYRFNDAVTLGKLSGNSFNATNKLQFFQLCETHNIPTVPYTTSTEEVEEWLANGSQVVARAVLRGHSGEGITILQSGIDDSSNIRAPLYTKYTPRTNEYRVHVVCGNIIDIQRKVRVRDVPDENVNWHVRNLAGGFVYGREDLQLDRKHYIEIANIVDKMKTSGMLSDFAAIDLIRTAQGGRMLALEINSAPGLSGTTLERYTTALVARLNSLGAV